MRELAESGRYKGGPRPFGYEKDGVTIREDEAELIRVAASRVVGGVGISRIVKEWNAAGIKSATDNEWKNMRLKQTLLDPRIAGLCKYRGEVLRVAERHAVHDKQRLATFGGRRSTTDVDHLATVDSSNQHQARHARREQLFDARAGRARDILGEQL